VLDEEVLDEEVLDEEVLDEEVLDEEVLDEEELDEEELDEEELDEEELDEEGRLSTQQEIFGVDRLVEGIAAEMDQISSDFESDTALSDRSSTNMDIGELVMRALDESRDEDEYDEIEIIDEDDVEMRIGVSKEQADEADDWSDGNWGEDDIEDEDGLAA
jgi:hypothetical protein